ncbi:hypothetical protein UFOVP923_10 [uncultured Caudovirales phage]|uniref:Uncharacterized protein n=1 Tax=uncultured Caudovirales phage TaxID=2100421 RepID=A0A6J5PQH8_9CAUD|nr:hypothetical protein UFOVP923_10 [uncultured Caudovirales phage]
MAKKKLTPAQIVAAIQASGGDLGSTGLSQKQILTAFLSSPNLIQQFQKTAGEAVSPYQQFDPTHVYNPTEVANSVQYKYMTMGEKYQPFVKDYWAAIAKDTSPAGVTQTLDTTRKNLPAMAQKYGLSEEEINSILTPMQDPKEITAFSKAEASRQKKQFQAYNTQKVKLGVTNPETAKGDYLKKVTGIAGLGDIPDDASFVAGKEKEFLKLIKAKGVTDQRALNMYGKNFNTALLAGMKKSGKSAASLSLGGLLKKNIGNL